MHQVTIPPLSRIERTNQYFLLLALFFVSFSTWFTNIFVALCYLCFALSLVTRRPVKRIGLPLPGKLALALFALLVIAASWSIAPHADIASALRKYTKLFILPISIVLCLRDPALARRGMRYFAAGAVVLSLSCYLVWLQLMPTSNLGWWRVGDAVDSFSFKNHITIGILLSFASTASFLGATYLSKRRERFAAIAAGVFFAVPIMFLTQGRTGYVAVFLGLITLFILRGRVTPRRAAAASCALVLLFVGFYAVSPNVKLRTDALIHELKTEDERSPNGLRMSFFKVGLAQVTAHPVIGIGTGAFATAYAPTAAINWPPGSEFATLRHQPHSEFLSIAVQTGLVGLALYLAMLYALLRPALAARSFETDCLVLLWVIYVSCSIFNSLLWDPTEAYWFLMLGACLHVAALARNQERLAAAPPGPSVSVIVTTYNRPDALEAVLSALFHQTEGNYEIIVADDGSRSDTRDLVERMRLRSPVPMQHVWQEDKGFRLSMARNRGIRASRGDYILILDGDCLPQRDYVAQHRKLARRGFIVTGSRILLGPDFTAQVLAAQRDLQQLGLVEKLRLRLRGDINKVLQLLFRLPDLGRERTRFSFRRIKGCNLAAWRSDLDTVNGFDESFLGWGHEDADFVLRMFNAGVLRKDGAFATEVLHLWHREAERDQESSNKAMVLQRVADKTVLAARGLAQDAREP